MKKNIIHLLSVALLFSLSACFGGKTIPSASQGGEVVGVSGRPFVEPTPYGMTKINRGSLRMGLETQDSLWGFNTPTLNTNNLGCGCAIAFFVHA